MAKNTVGMLPIVGISRHVAAHRSLYFFRAPVERGHHEWFALRRLITNSRNFASSGVSEVLIFSQILTSGRNGGGRNEQLEGYSARQCVVLKISNGAPIQHDPNTSEIITHRCDLAMFWLFSVISLQQFIRWKFWNYVCGIKHVFIINHFGRSVEIPKRSKQL